MNTIIIQARMSSTRLPGKVMKDLSGQTVLWHTITRCQQAKKVDQVIVATTTGPEDQVIVDLCAKLGVTCVRGSLENVLERYYQAAQAVKADVIVRITSDCPLIDPAIIDLCLEAFEKNKSDYISNVVPGERTFPRGLDTEIFSLTALTTAQEQATESFEQEHVTPYIWQNKKGEFKIGPIITAPAEYQADYRLVIDYPEDYQLLQKIYEHFYREGEIIKVPEVITWLNAHPEIASLNAHCEQKPLK